MARHSIGCLISDVEVVRQPRNNAYFGLGGRPTGSTIERVYRVGKHVVLELRGCGLYVDCHNAMTGYWDWEHEPWTFDYVEGARRASDADVRVRITLDSGRVLRFHDLRFFGRLSIASSLPSVGLELMETPNMMPGAKVVSLREFAEWILRESRPVKDALMDQTVVSGIGNIYASEGCHLAGIDPHTPGQDLEAGQVPVLLEALRCVVAHQIPIIGYQHLVVYRRDLCGSCGGPVTRTEVSKRATFMCRGCQG